MALNNLQLRSIGAALTAIGACGAIIFWSLQPPPPQMLPARSSVSTALTAAPVAANVRATPSMFESAHADAAEILATTADPFGTRNWNQKQPAPAPKIEQLVSPVMPPAVVAPPQIAAPVLPFKYMGQMEDAGRTIVYLSRGEQTVVARMGEVLDQQYKITSISPAAVEFEITATGEKLSLSIPVSQ